MIQEPQNKSLAESESMCRLSQESVPARVASLWPAVLCCAGKNQGRRRGTENEAPSPGTWNLARELTGLPVAHCIAPSGVPKPIKQPMHDWDLRYIPLLGYRP